MVAKLADLLSRLESIEKGSADSTLVIYKPDEEQAAFYHKLCEFYLKSPEADRVLIRDAVRDKPGVMNNLLGYVYTCIRVLQETGDDAWFKVGLAAAALRGDGPDYRDFYLAMADLYTAGLDANSNSKAAFSAIGGGVPTNFDTYAVLKSRLVEYKKIT
jgi:hypothetical protein